MKKKFLSRVQDLSQKAAQIRHVVEAAPAQAAQLRDTVLSTAGQLQQMRQEVQSSLTGLRADSGDRLAEALREIHEQSAVFEEAGYAVDGIDMELSPVQRVVVHFAKVASVPESAFRALLGAQAARPTTYSLLAALAKADAVAEKLRVPPLTCREVVVHVGPTPSVRLCWRAPVEEETDTGPEAPPPLAAPTSAGAQVSAPPPLPSFASGGFFEARPATAPAPAAPPPSPAAPAVAPTVAPALAPASTSGSGAEPRPAVEGSDWKRSALERFKKMPDASKYRR